MLYSNSCAVLHPKYNLKYFEKCGWDKEWIETAKEIIREEFKQNHTAYKVPSFYLSSSKSRVCFYCFHS